MSVSEILTLVIALYGAIISTILAIRQIRTRVMVLYEVHTLATAEKTEHVVEISAVNTGHRTVEIRELGFKDEFGTALSKELDTPSKLEPGTSIKHQFAYEDVVKKLGTLTAIFAEDTSRRSYDVDLDAHDKERILWGPFAERLFKVAGAIVEAEGIHDQARQHLERSRERLDEVVSAPQKLAKELRKKHREWDDYRARTGETHPEAQKHVDDTLRYIHEADQDTAEGVGEEQEGRDRG
jgi:hypothetical protein